MMTSRISKVILVCLATSLSSCVQLRFSQYDKLNRLFNEARPEILYHPYLWNVSMGDYQNRLLQVDLADSYGFTNNAQDAVIFANNRIIAIGPVGPYDTQLRVKQITLATNPSLSTSQSITYATTVNDVQMSIEVCDEWKTVTPRVIQQDCKSTIRYTNQITQDQYGNMIELNQYIPFYNTRLVMQKVTVTTASE